MTPPKTIRGVIRDHRTLKPLLERYYARPGNGAWGNLHIALDDGNLDDDSLWRCERWAMERRDFSGARIARLLRLCSLTQRFKLARRDLGMMASVRFGGR